MPSLSQDMEPASTRLLVGLGNPGERYAHTRHNIGFAVADALADEARLAWRPAPPDALITEGRLWGTALRLVKPLAFMNRSGGPVRRIAEQFTISIREMLVIHDDIDLDLGRIKIKEKGGDGGHRGLRSLIEAFGSGDFARLRIGIGRPEQEADIVEHVLGAFSATQRTLVPRIIQRAQDAVAIIVQEGVSAGMNRFNGLPGLHINSA